MIEPSRKLSPALVAALNASYGAGGWRTIGVWHNSGLDAEGALPETLSMVILQVENATLGQVHVWEIGSTDGETYDIAKLNAGGGLYVTNDATLIGRLAATIEPALADMQAELAAALTGAL